MPDFDLFGQSARNLNPEDDPKTKRLIDWNVESLHKLLKEIVARRNVGNNNSSCELMIPPREEDIKCGETFLDEVKDIISLPRFDASFIRNQDDELQSVVLPDEVILQLRDYVTCIAAMYRDNPFHSFEHAR